MYRVSLQDHLRQVTTEEGVLVDWQQEVMEEEAELWEDWQQEVEEGDIKEEGSKLPQVNDRKKTCEVRTEDKMNSMGLPFLTGISPAGFLSANKKKPGGTDHLVQVRTGYCYFLSIHSCEHLYSLDLHPSSILNPNFYLIA